MNIRTIKVSYKAQLGLPNMSYLVVGVELEGELEPDVEHDSNAEAMALLEMARTLVDMELHPLEQQRQAAEPRLTRTVASEGQRQGMTSRSALAPRTKVHTRPAPGPKRAAQIIDDPDEMPAFRFTDDGSLQVECPSHGWSFARVFPNNNSATGKIAKCGRKEQDGTYCSLMVAWDGE